MISLYPALTDCDPAESHDFTGTLGQFFDGQGAAVNWRERAVQPVSVSVNGAPVPASSWDKTRVTPGDDVQIRLIPRGGVVNFIRKVDPIMNWLMKSITPKQQQQGSSQSGQKLETASATANVPKLNEVVPELAGRYIRYPDYLTPPRRYFAAPREQWLEFLCCIGPGRYQVLPEDVKIGETTFASLGADASYEIFEPGQSMSGHPAMDIWYSAPEVGSTSSGTAGLEIPTEYTGTADGGTVATEYAFNGNQITIMAPVDGHWASGLRAGSRITDISLPLQYDVLRRVQTPGQTDFINRFTGNFQEILPLSIGSTVSTPTFSVTGSMLVKDMSLDAAGNGWIEFETSFGADVNPYPTGTQNITFKTGGLHRYEVISVSSKTITVRWFAGSPVSVPVDPWLGFATVTSTSATVTADTSSFAGDWTGLYAATPKKETTSSTQLDFFCTGGLGSFDEETGELSNLTVEIEIAYRDRLTGGAFTTVTRSFTAATPDDIGFTETINHAAMVPEFQVRRLGVGSASSSDYNKIQWTGLRSYMMAKPVYPNWTTMFVRIRAGGNVAQGAENKINLVATRILPTMQPDGTFGAPVPTRDISAFVRHITQSIGYTENDIDIPELLRLHNTWTARGDTFNHVYDATTVKEAINAALGAGMAEMTVENGMIRAVRDEPRSVFEQPYSPQNMTGQLRRSWKSKRHDDFDGVDVEYMDENTWTKETVKCRLLGDLGAKVETLKLIGPTNRDRAWRIGMRRRRELKYRIWNYQFGTEMDALNSRYLSYVPLIDDIVGYGKSSILVSITSSGGKTLLQVTEPMMWELGAQHVVAYRKPDGKLAGPFPATPGPTPFHILAPIPAPWPVVTLKHEPPHVYFGPQDKWTFPALVTGVTPSGRDAVSVSATNYSELVYVDDDNFAPEE